jgi:hypothetical protein
MATNAASSTPVYLAYATAKRLAQENGVTNLTKWAALVRQYKARSKVLPAKPQEAYASQWESWPAFLGVNTRVGRPETGYWTFAKARKFVRALKLTTQQEFLDYARSTACPMEVPVYPQSVYKGKGWAGYADFLGSSPRGVAASRIYWPFEQAQAYVHKLALPSTHAWRQWSRSAKRPVELPLMPNLAYRDRGWTNWADFLGPEYQRVAQLTGLRRHMDILPYDQARAFVVQLGLESAQDYRVWAMSGQRPDTIPIHPEVAYRGATWKGWADFLGQAAKRRLSIGSPREVLSFAAAQSVVHALQLQSAQDYFDLVKLGHLPNGLPAQPEQYYAQAGWTTWTAFLGVRAKPSRGPRLKTREDGLLTFSEARKFVRSLNLSNTAAWFKYASGALRPVYVPKEPWKAYLLDGYKTLEDFIGLPAA